ncbi:gluconokinase [Phenylobacterium sp.]|uniref:gluconokinase n=1 Tax=Phenylobacterium sp. TaxID=1871053 RepID=UPI00271FC91C|nr:gluconokinase [Phenylobacterium sp.]MDO8379290.1 gluconokinase [Phenylobacterium sp.]
MPTPLPASEIPQLVIMGVAGAGKSTLMRALAARLGWACQDGDDLHPAANVARMVRGEPLTDADRAPWLAAIGAWLDARRVEGRPAIVACSALKRAYRDGLRYGRPGLRFVWLKGEPAVLRRRLAGRAGHFVGQDLLASQIATLETPTAEEEVITVDIDLSTEAQADQVLAALGPAAATGPGDRGPRPL